MKKYIDRLTKCGYTEHKASIVCSCFIRNLSILDLECFVSSMEKVYHVD